MASLLLQAPSHEDIQVPNGRGVPEEEVADGPGLRLREGGGPAVDGLAGVGGAAGVSKGTY